MILVTGTGRSGTTAIAEALISMGVDMGPAESPGHEDQAFVHANRELLAGRIELAEWMALVLSAVREEPWGFKDPRAAIIIGHYWELFYPDILVVWARRNMPDALSSWAKAYPDEPTEERHRTAHARFDALTTWSEISTHGFLTIDMDEHRPEDELKAVLAPFLAGEVTHDRAPRGRSRATGGLPVGS